MQERGSGSRIYSSSILILEIVSALKNIFQRREITRGISVDTFRKITFSIPLPIHFLLRGKKSQRRDSFGGQIFSLMKFMMPRKFIKTLPLSLPPPPCNPLLPSPYHDYDVKYFSACILPRSTVTDLPHPFYLLHPLYTTLQWTVKDRSDISLSSESAKSIIVASEILNKYQQCANI